MVYTEVTASTTVKNTTGGRIQGIKLLIKHHVCWHTCETSPFLFSPIRTNNPTESMHAELSQASEFFRLRNLQTIAEVVYSVLCEAVTTF